MDRDVADEDLMLRYRDGDAAAFETLYTRHKGGLFRFIARQCEDRAHAEEIFQEVWMNLIAARSRYRVEAKFVTYLYHLAHNRLIDHYRKHKGRVPVSFDDEDCAEVAEFADPHQKSIEEKLTLKQQVEKLLKLLTQLPEAQREAFLLHEEAGLSMEEIARVTGVSKEAAKSRLRYALAKLREGLHE